MVLPKIEEIKKEFDALIFDLDGTLLDSMTLWYRVDQEFLNKRGFEVTPDYTEFVKSSSMEEGAVYTRDRFGLRETPEEIMDEWNKMVYREYRENIRLKDGAKDYIVKAHKAGLKIACATALSARNATAALTSNGISEYMDKLVTLDDIGSNVNKSDPHIYLITSSAIGIRPDRCLVFEDIPAAIRGARSGGFGTCAVYDDIGCNRGAQWEEMTKESDYSFRSWRSLI